MSDYMIWILFGLVLLNLFQSHRSGISGLEFRLRRLEGKVDLLMKHANLTYEDKSLEAARTLVRAGQHIEAIKYIRRETGLGLKEAKDIADSLK